MPIKQPRYSAQEAGRLGEAIYERTIRAQVEPEHNEEIVAIDIETGEWEIDADEDTAANRLEARLPDAQIYVLRAGPLHAVRKFGAGRSRQTS